MDFSTVLNRLIESFQAHQIKYALIGGVALGIWGAPRATVDLDFLVQQEDMPSVHDIMGSLGYSC